MKIIFQKDNFNESISSEEIYYSTKNLILGIVVVRRRIKKNDFKLKDIDWFILIC